MEDLCEQRRGNEMWLQSYPLFIFFFYSPQKAPSLPANTIPIKANGNWLRKNMPPQKRVSQNTQDILGLAWWQYCIGAHSIPCSKPTLR